MLKYSIRDSSRIVFTNIAEKTKGYSFIAKTLYEPMKNMEAYIYHITKKEYFQTERKHFKYLQK